MAVKEFCSNGTMMHTDSFSSPIPLIGLYIATASLVCLILILCDVYVGFRRRKFWLPCRYFSLNSITLTLLSVSTKIPVDLTTAMPRAEDQLSKLCGTAFICITMGFMIPSIATNAEFESYANITALSIFVITVIINVCIQMATGVIFTFHVEHSVMLFLMLLLLTRFWLSVVVINAYKGVYTDRNKDLIRKGEKCMLERLKVCYLHGYHSSPQFLSCKVPYVGHVTLVCVACFLVLVEAVLRSFVFNDVKFCEGASDYKWSVWLMVGTQIITILVVTSAIIVRWLTFANHIEENLVAVCKLPYEPYLQFRNLFSFFNLPKPLEASFRYAIYYPLDKIDFLVTTLALAISKFATIQMRKYFRSTSAERPMEKFKDVLEAHQVVIEQWILRKGVDDMEKWMKLNRMKRPVNLINLLSSSLRPSEESLTYNFLTAEYEISCLSMLILVEVAKITMQSSVSESLAIIFGEVFETIHFIDENTSVGSFQNKLRSIHARIIWKYGRKVKFQPKSIHPLAIIKEFQQSFGTLILRDEVRDIVQFLQGRSSSSSESLCDDIQKLFVDMLHVLLSRLPDAIFNHILESPIEEYEDRVSLGLKMICKFAELQTHVQFSFPSGSKLTTLVDTNLLD